jgi:hypothetical protein
MELFVDMTKSSSISTGVSALCMAARIVASPPPARER